MASARFLRPDSDFSDFSANALCARAQDGVYTDCSCGNAGGYRPTTAEWEGRQLAFDAALAMAKARSSPASSSISIGTRVPARTLKHPIARRPNMSESHIETRVLEYPFSTPPFPHTKWYSKGTKTCPRPCRNQIPILSALTQTPEPDLTAMSRLDAGPSSTTTILG